MKLLMTRFILQRLKDVSGVSGTGVAAEGIVFSDGQVALRWLGDVSSVVIHKSVENVIKVHCHAGSTEFVPYGLDLD